MKSILMRHLGKVLLRYMMVILSLFCISACDKDKTPPGEVMNLVARGGLERVSLTWKEPQDADLASILVTEIGADKIYAQPRGLNGMTIEGLTNGTSYEFAVVTVDLMGNKSDAVHASATPFPAFVVVDPDQNDYEPEVYVDYSDGYETLVPSATFEVDSMGLVHLTLTLNRPLDESSVISGQTIYLEGSAVSPVNVGISEDDKTLNIISADPFSTFGESSASASYLVYMFDFVLVGEDTGDGTVLDSNGIPLDGDDDGFAGGDFVLEFTVNEQIN